MNIGIYAVWPWLDWDWRPSARLAGWFTLAAAAARCHHASLLTILFAMALNFVVLWCLSFGVFTQVLVLTVEGAWWLAVAADDVAYRLADWLVRRIAGRISSIPGFLAAFGVEILLFLAAIHSWNAVDMGPRLMPWFLRSIQ